MAANHVRYQVTRVLNSSANREEDRKGGMAANHVRYQVTRVLNSSANREEDRKGGMAANHVWHQVIQYSTVHVQMHQPRDYRNS
jgi:hypothetical protein